MNPRESIKNCIEPRDIDGNLTMEQLGMDTYELIMELENKLGKPEGHFSWINDSTTVSEIEDRI